MIDMFPTKLYPFIVKGSKVDLQANVKENSFSDGYAQRIKIGINNEKQTLTINFKGLPEKNLNELKSFVLPRLNFIPILFKYSKDEEKQYIIRSFSATNNGNEISEAEMVLEQDYNIYLGVQNG